MKDVRLVIRSFKYYLFVRDESMLTIAMVKALSSEFPEPIILHNIIIDEEPGVLIELVEGQNYIWGFTASDKLRLLRKSILKYYEESRFV